MSSFTPIPAASMKWERNVLGSEVTRLRTDGAMLTIVHGRKGDVVPPHGYSKGSVTYVVTGRIEVDGTVMGPGDAGTYTAPGDFFSVKFLDDATYIVARADADEITVSDLGERSAHNLDA
ncbi:MAG: hypothetical protein IPO93_11110 [Actinobacteria bacterium]|jgi:hypothetical protein|nr:hypothetical protein [Actinomycetota bacterium]